MVASCKSKLTSFMQYSEFNSDIMTTFYQPMTKRWDFFLFQDFFIESFICFFSMPLPGYRELHFQLNSGVGELCFLPQANI